MGFLLAFLKLRAMESRHYWRLRALNQLAGASATTLQVNTRKRVAELVSLLSVGLRAFGGSLLFLAGPIIGLWLTQSVTRVYIPARAHGNSLSRWAGAAVHWVTSTVDPGFDSSTLTNAAIGVAGIFVAVYFATVTFVISTTYKDATRRLRGQIVRQPESRWYAAFFTQTVVYTACTLALPLLKRTPTNLTLTVVGLAAALVVISFGRIWSTLFVLLEPTSMFAPIQRTLTRWVRRAHQLGRKRAPSGVGVQRANSGIRESLETINDLITLILDREHERAGGRGVEATFDPRIGTALRHLRSAWRDYAQMKYTIRTLPGWSPKRSQAKDWFLSSHSEVSVALATGTTLAASQVIDDLWFERWIADFTERLLSGRDLTSIERAMRGLPPLSRALGASGQFAEMRLWLTATTFAPMASVGVFADSRERLDVAADLKSLSTRSLSREEHFALPDEASAHNLVDFVMLEALNACLGYTDYFQRLGSVLPNAPEHVLNRGEQLPAGSVVTQTIGNLRTAVSLEVRVEGARVTPDAAIRQLFARGLATEVMNELAQFVAYTENELWPWVLQVGQAKAWAAGAALSRAWELTEKLATAASASRGVLEACENFHVEPDERWPDTGAIDIEARTRALEDRLELPIAKLAAAVDAAPDSDRPDHFGWAYYRAHENLLRRVLDCDPGDSEVFRQKVLLHYKAGDIATRRLMATVRQNDPAVISAYVAEPYLRFLQLSGIALVVSEIRGDLTLFAPFESVWAVLLQTPKRATEILARAAATVASESTLIGLTSGAVDRTNIEMRAHRAIEALGVPRELFDMGSFGRYARTADDGLHLSGSALRLLRRVRSNHFEGAFYAGWLRPRAIDAGATVPAGVEEHLRMLDFDDSDVGQMDGDDD